MALSFDKQRPIPSPALAPAATEFEREGELTIGLINNMPDSALKATERQFMRLVRSAAGKTRLRFHCFSLPSVPRSRQAREWPWGSTRAEHLEHMLSRQQGIDYSLESSSNAGGGQFRLWNKMPGS